MPIRPPLFLLTGFFWLLASAFLGVVLFMGTMLSLSVPPQLRLIHVHGALVGGVAQMILGALLAFVPALLMTGRDRPSTHPWLYAAINGGTVGMLAGLATGRHLVVAAAGALVLLAFLAVLKDGLSQARTSLAAPPLNLWFYGVAVIALLIGLGMGLTMALKRLPLDFYGQGRLAHIHLNLLGFVTLTIIGTMHNLYPTVLNSPLFSQRLARWTFLVMPIGIALLVAGFLTGHLLTQLMAGAAIVAGTLLYGYNMVRTWTAAGRPSGIASDHFLLATFFLLLTGLAGVLVSVNYFWDPPYLPVGKLHLVAYTHLALVGFILQTIMGALSHLLPIVLAVGRVKSHKKRGPYLAELTAVMEHWRPIQVISLNLGLIALLFVAAMVWQFSLRVPLVQVAAWLSAGLLTISLLLFGAKVVRLLLHHPADRSEE